MSDRPRAALCAAKIPRRGGAAGGGGEGGGARGSHCSVTWPYTPSAEMAGFAGGCRLRKGSSLAPRTASRGRPVLTETRAATSAAAASPASAADAEARAACRLHRSIWLLAESAKGYFTGFCFFRR